MWRVCAILTALMLGSGEAMFDLFIEAKDFQKLLGVNSELWYVRDGEVKENALDYVVPVPSDISVLTFQWRARHNILLPYAAQTHVGNPEAALVKLSVNTTGSVPTSTQPFHLIINCTGKLSTQVDVTLNIQVPLRASLHHLTNLTIHRRKICYRNAGENVTTGSSVPRGGGVVVYVAVAALAAFLLLVAALAAHNHRTRHTKHGRRSRRCMGEVSTDQQPSCSSPCLPTPTNPMNCPAPSLPHSSQHSFVAPSTSTGPSAPGGWAAVRREASLASAPSSWMTQDLKSSLLHTSPGDVLGSSDCESRDVMRRMKQVQVADGQVQEVQVVQEGTFGRLLTATYTSTRHPSPERVLVKTLAGGSSNRQRQVVLQEALQMVGLEHPHLLQVMALVWHQPSDPPMLLYRAPLHGNMKRFLQSCSPLVTRQVVQMALQLLQALSFLHAARILHADVAARNCWLDTGLRVQLCDCALSRDLFPGDYDCLGDNNNRPVKWLAIEALQRHAFSPQSDVWAWGVTVWEVMTLGQQPYAEVDAGEMEEALLGGVRLAQPINCPDQL
ncbi:tyrosine-protein kinase Drl isoform X2 [Hyalella azteca]|uniref:Tyrosine-protein kinase Drl isoform X2 n=1 Tax=Hyalella azteca TaxID=294128 RepID=A0A979FU92_HYAAZ|nr:tyrosine-protein kinase Drl isoform X2 [Hyalella azteca]